MIHKLYVAPWSNIIRFVVDIPVSYFMRLSAVNRKNLRVYNTFYFNNNTCWSNSLFGQIPCLTRRFLKDSKSWNTEYKKGKISRQNLSSELPFRASMLVDVDIHHCSSLLIGRGSFLHPILLFFKPPDHELNRFWRLHPIFSRRTLFFHPTLLF